MKAYWIPSGDQSIYTVGPKPHTIQGGYHAKDAKAADNPLDALELGFGDTMDLVELVGDITPCGENLFWAPQRIHKKRINTDEILREFTRWCALQVVDLWDECPQSVVDYLNTGIHQIGDKDWPIGCEPPASWAIYDATVKAFPPAYAARNVAWIASWARRGCNEKEVRELQKSHLQTLVDRAFEKEGLLSPDGA